MARGKKGQPIEERFWEKVDKSAGSHGCWLWTAFINPNGYGTFRYPGEQLAHRIAYLLTVGPIPEGRELDHVADRGCKHRHCVNPAHLEPVTHLENVRRGKTSRKTHCKFGHLLAGENLMPRKSGRRLCRPCYIRRTEELAAEQKAARHERAAIEGRECISIAEYNARKTHCPQGHPLTPDNLQPFFLRQGKRYCLLCHRESARRSKAKSKARQIPEAA